MFPEALRQLWTGFPAPSSSLPEAKEPKLHVNAKLQNCCTHELFHSLLMFRTGWRCQMKNIFPKINGMANWTISMNCRTPIMFPFLPPLSRPKDVTEVERVPRDAVVRRLVARQGLVPPQELAGGGDAVFRGCSQVQSYPCVPAPLLLYLLRNRCRCWECKAESFWSITAEMSINTLSLSGELRACQTLQLTSTSH